MMEAHLFNEIINALKPLVDIADAYDRNKIDPDFGEQTFVAEVDGTTLLSIKDCWIAREVSNNLKKLIGAA